MLILTSAIVVGFSILLLPSADHDEQPNRQCIRCNIDISDSQTEEPIVFDLTGHPMIEGQVVDGNSGKQPFQRKLTGKFELAWDDSIGSSLDEQPKTCVVKFNDIDGELSGQFIGPVAGAERNAIITGRLEGSGLSRILTFQQREDGYICSYQAIDNGGEILGVWHDTKNRSGSFRLLKYQ